MAPTTPPTAAPTAAPTTTPYRTTQPPSGALQSTQGGFSNFVAPPVDPAAGETVVDVRILGNKKVSTSKILNLIKTHQGRPFEMQQVEKDVRNLNKSGLFASIEPSYQKVPGGRIVLFKVVERPLFGHIKFVGNKKVKTSLLEKECGLRVGSAADPFAVEDARRALEYLYRDRGFALARVTIQEGNEPGDEGAIFVINEGPKQRILWASFVGNTIASDSRLRTQIQSKQGILWIFQGEFDWKKIEEDKDKLTAYYRSLGFFRAKVGAKVDFTDSGEWAKVTFVINEGDRYQIENISVAGNKKFTEAKLLHEFELDQGDFFDQAKMNGDVRSIKRQYGRYGYIFADVKAEPRFLEEPGKIDLMLHVKEGKRYRVGSITPVIKGDNPHTRLTAVLNQVSLEPGDIINIDELRASERRLRSCQLFESNPAMGKAPKITFSPADAIDQEEWDRMQSEKPQVAQPPARPDGFRGQSPDRDADRNFDPDPTSTTRWPDGYPQRSFGGQR